MTEIQLFPAYKEALRLFEEKGFKYGDLITKEWLFESLGLKWITDDMPVKEADPIRFKYMEGFKHFQTVLLEEKKMALDNVYGEGYRIVTPGDQTRWAEEEALRAMRKAMNMMVHREVNVDHNLLTTEQKTENSNALARAGMLKSLVRKTYKRDRIEFSGEDE